MQQIQNVKTKMKLMQHFADMQQTQNVKTKMKLMQHFCQYAANSKCKIKDETHAAFSPICSKFKM